MRALPCCALSTKRELVGKEWKSTKSFLSLSFRPMTMITIKITNSILVLDLISSSCLPIFPELHCLMIARGLLIGNQSLKRGLATAKPTGA